MLCGCKEIRQVNEDNKQKTRVPKAMQCFLSYGSVVCQFCVVFNYTVEVWCKYQVDVQHSIGTEQSSQSCVSKAYFIDWTKPRFSNAQ